MPSCWKDAISPDGVIALFTGILTVVAVWQTVIYVKTLRMARFQQRAWVGVVKICATMEVDSPIKTMVSFQNAGQGPALEMMRSTNLWVLRSTEPFRLDLAPNNPPTDTGLILPGESQSSMVKTAEPLTSEMLEAIKSGQFRVYVFGELTYSDILGRHRTEFLRFWEPSFSVWAIAETHNKVD